GFNAGSAVAANGIASLAFTATMLAPAGTLVVWTVLDILRSGKPTAVGCATAIVVGLVAITPAAGYVGPMSAIALGALAAFPSYFGLLWRGGGKEGGSRGAVGRRRGGGGGGGRVRRGRARKSGCGVGAGVRL